MLSVRHTDASRRGVAIGILHGEADAVVPVACAYRTEKIYRDEGYENVKLYVVEGLTERSGHWPLPVQAGEMFAWLDEVTEVSAQKAADRALAGIRAEAPDLEAIAGNLARAQQLAKRVDPEDPERFAKTVEMTAAFLSECRDAHVEAVLVDEGQLKARKPEYGAWAASFRAAHRAFAEDPEWGKALGSVSRTAKADDKKCAKALRNLSRGASAKAVRSATKALETAVRAVGYDALERELARYAAEPPEGLKAKDRSALEELLEARRAADEEGAASAARLTAEVAKAFRERFPEVGGGDGGK